MAIKTIYLVVTLALSVTAYDGLGIPLYSDTSSIVRHSGFTLQYSEKFEQAQWVAYFLTRERASVSIPRTDNFRADPLVKTGSAQLEDYKYSGYDRGHLFPAADSWDTSSMNDCFFLSNISPQIHAFNAGIWEKLESQIRLWVVDSDTLFIVTAGVLKEGLKTIGTDSVAVPDYFYKVLLKKYGSELYGIGFLLESVNSDLPLKHFAVTIDSIEKTTGIDFFPQLSDSIESRVEGSVDIRQWFPEANVKIFKPQVSSIQSTLYFDLQGRSIDRKPGQGHSIIIDKALRRKIMVRL